MNKKKIIIIFFLASTAVLATVLSYAMDYPHNASKSVSCEDCHYVWGSEASLMIEGLSYGNNIDDTQYNALCWSCHQPLDATPVETHSSLQIDNGYGDWSFECVECHDAHGNYQFRMYGSSSYFAQDTVASVNTTTVTRSATTPVWANDQFQGMILIPNIAYDYNNYLITGNDNTSITVEGTIDTSKVAINDTFAVVYSNMVKSTIATPNSGNKTVKLFNSTGPNSFADGDTTYEGVCEVCHTQTMYHRNDGGGDHDHNKGLDCMTCHQHTKGFSVACDTCHGNPPIVNTATGGPDGLANSPAATGSLTAGAHNVHVNTKSFGCVVCHYDSVGTGATHNNGSAVTMGFYLFGGAQQGGSYDGQSAVSYNATTTSPVTSVANNDNKTCSSVYCHSTGQSTASGGIITPTYASPVWDDPASGDCGTCHKVEELLGLTSGSHEAHLETTGVLGCAECHTGAENDASAYNSANHVNTLIDVAHAYDAGGSPGNGYGKCSTGRCHDDGLGNPKLTPQWGNPGAGCAECHLSPPSTGSHVKHVTTTNYNTAECGDCHDGADINTTTAPSQHLDANIDVYDVSPGDLGYSQNVAKGGAPYDSCSTAYCHSPGQASDGGPSAPAYATVTWGDTAACGTCHEVSVGSVTSGSHDEHLNATGVNGCGDCHTDAANDASAYNSSSHVDGSIDVANTYSIDGTPGNGYGTCSAASCHDDGTGTLVDTSVWGADDANCMSCHNAAPESGSHTEHLNADRVCAECHKGAVKDTTAPVEHLDDDIDVYETDPGDLNYTTDKLKGSPYATCSNIYCHGNYNGSGLNASPTWGTAASGACGTCHGASNSADSFPDSGSHERHVDSDATLNGTPMGIYNRNYACTFCHKDVVSGSGPSSYSIADTAKHVSDDIDWSFDTSDSRLSIGTPAYTIASGTLAPSDGTGRAYGNCTVYCHSNVQPDGGVGAPTIYGYPSWGGSLQCGSCHGRDSHSALGNIIDTGSHTKHLSYGFTAAGTYKKCDICHKMGTVDINVSECGSCHVENEPTVHVNGTVDMIFDAPFVGASATYDDISGTPGQPGNGYFDCSNTYCHSNATGGTGQTGDPRGVAANTSSDWGTSGPLACDSCHDGTATGPGYADGTPKANSHANHTSLYGCVTCHDKTVDGANSIISTSWHVNSAYDVSGTVIGSYTYAADGGTCTAAACHGGGTPQWGDNSTGIDVCTRCHGTATASPAPDYKKAPPQDTAGHAGTGDAQVGAHQAHLQSSLASNIACSECHTVPSNVDDADHINDGTPGTAELNFGSLASTGTASPDYTAGVCSSVYCHGGAMPKGGTDGVDETPSWNNDSYLNGVPANDCTRCHGYPPSGIAAHSGKGPTDCITCHNYGINAAGTGFTDPSNHINGSLDGGGDNCTSCHSAAGGSTAGSTPDTTHAKHVGSYFVNGAVSTNDYGNTNGGTNADWLKVNVNSETGEYQYGCGNCHPINPTYHQNGTVNITMNSSHGGILKSLNNVSNDTSGYAQTEGTSVTCSVSYCHSDAKGTFQTTPEWYSQSFAGNECAACHDDPPMYANTGVGTANANSHYTPDGFMGGPAAHIGIHYDNVYSGTTGLLAEGGGAGSGAGHGDPNTSTTMACTICHAATVDWVGDSSSYSTLSYAGTLFDCSAAGCHDGSTAFQNTAGVITDKTLHVNGSKDIVMMTDTLKSKSQLRDAYFNKELIPYGWQRNNGYKQGTNSYDSTGSSNQYVPASKTCLTSCHIGESVKWGDPGLDCNSCHSDM